MDKPAPRISSSFRAFSNATAEHVNAWGRLVQQLSEASALDRKTADLAYLAVLGTILVGLPVAGHAVTQALPAAIEAYNNLEN